MEMVCLVFENLCRGLLHRSDFDAHALILEMAN